MCSLRWGFILQLASHSLSLKTKVMAFCLFNTFLFLLSTQFASVK